MTSTLYHLMCITLMSFIILMHWSAKLVTKWLCVRVRFREGKVFLLCNTFSNTTNTFLLVPGLVDWHLLTPMKYPQPWPSSAVSLFIGRSDWTRDKEKWLAKLLGYTSVGACSCKCYATMLAWLHVDLYPPCHSSSTVSIHAIHSLQFMNMVKFIVYLLICEVIFVMFF